MTLIGITHVWLVDKQVPLGNGQNNFASVIFPVSVRLDAFSPKMCTLLATGVESRSVVAGKPERLLTGTVLGSCHTSPGCETSACSPACSTGFNFPQKCQIASQGDEQPWVILVRHALDAAVQGSSILFISIMLLQKQEGHIWKLHLTDIKS